MNETIKKYRGHFSILILFLTACIVWYLVFYYEARAGKMIVHIFDVGQGDGIFIEAPDGNIILIDGGPDKTILSKIGQTLLPWNRTIDLAILTHPHADHLDGLFEVLKRYDITMVLEAGVPYSTPEYREWNDLLETRHIPVVIARSGQKIIIGDSEYDVFAPLEDFQLTSPKNIHDSMVTGKLSFASSSVLFMGDAEKKLEYRLIANGFDLQSDILKVGHHGSKTSTSPDFVARVSPFYAVISLGRKNKYGHPHQTTLDTLKNAGVSILRTDEDGDITLVSDGQKFEKQ